MKNIKHLLFIIVAGLAISACGGDDIAGEREETGEETIALNAPSNLQVHTVTRNSVIVSWQGDSTALYHDVFVSGGDTISVASTSCGIDGLQQNTTYSWHVRARRGETTSAFVTGPSFTTEAYNDVITAWTGKWYNKGWDGSISLFGNEVPYSEFSAFMPDSLNPERMGVMEFTIEEAEDGILAITFPTPTIALAGPFPTGRVLFPLVEDKASIEQPLSNTIPLVTEPVPIGELPFLDDLGDNMLAEYDSVSITEFTVNLTKLTFTFGPPAADTIPAFVTIDGTATIKTDDALLNALLDFLLPNDKLKIKITSTLYRKEE